MVGQATFSINLTSFNVQVSNFGNDSFLITNTGDKKIAQVDIDVTNALYPDSVFDPFGQAGDTASKKLTINTDGGTGVVAPSNDSYIGVGGTAGYEGLRLIFDETVNGGFESGETIGFAVDMDANSIAGSQKSTLDAGTDPFWDVGGVSGAELIGSTYLFTFTDGTTATGQLQAVGNQAGSQGLASEDLPNLSSSLTVNGLGAGGIGTYDENGPTVIVNGPVGETARVVLTKGFIQPVTNEFYNGDADDQAYAPILDAQLATLAASDFPANNAVEFQIVDVALTGGDQDISNLFDFSGVSNYNFPGEDRIPLGFVTSIIDPTNDNLPIGPVTSPIYLEFAEQTEVSITPTQENASEPNTNGEFTVSLSEVASTDTIVSYTVTGTATPDQDYTALSGTVTIPAGQISTSIDVSVIDDSGVESNEDVTVTLDSITSGDSDVVVDPINNSATVTITDDDASIITIEAGANASEPNTNGQFTVNLSKVPSTDTTISYTVTGTATPDQDYTALSGTVTIPAGQVSTPIDLSVMDDLAVEGDESVTVTLDNITAGDSNQVLDTNNNSATVTIFDNDAPIIYEAEAADTIVNYRTENISVASGGQVLSFRGGSGNEVGSATFTFNELAGNYDIVLGGYDENDGEGQFVIELNDFETGTTTEIGNLLLNQQLGSNGGNAQTFISPVVAAGVDLTPGDSITVHGFEEGGEHARFDFIQLNSNVVTPLISIASETNGSEPNTNGQFTVSLSEVASTDTVISYNVGGTATADQDYTSLPGSVTIPAGQLSASIDVSVSDDLEVEGTEDVTVTLDSITAGDSDLVIDLNNNSAAVTITDDDVPNSISITSESNVSEPNTNGQFTVNLSEVASTDTVVSYNVGGTATPDQDYTSLPGSVTIPAGQLSASIDVSVSDDSEVEGTEDVTVTLDSITSGDSDLLLDPSNSSASVSITDDELVPTSFIIEAENADIITNYRTENISAASGGQALSFRGGGSNESGSATFGFNETSGIYDIIVAGFDENDGVGQFVVKLNDFETGTTTEIGNLLLDQDLGSNLGNAQTFISPVVASGVSLTPGDSITVDGFENAGEHARFDYIEFSPVI